MLNGHRFGWIGVFLAFAAGAVACLFVVTRWQTPPSSRVIEFSTIVAEMLVAVVIYFEMEQSRRDHFLEKATTEHADHDRREIYGAFVEIPGEMTLGERSREFINKMYAEELHPAPSDGTASKGQGGITLKQRCDRQIALFNDLGVTISSWYSQRQPLVELFPHAAVYIWIILGPYIIQRRRDTGEWLAKPLLRFTLECASFILEKNQERGLELRGRGSRVSISRRDLLEVQRQLAVELQQPFVPSD
jgi:hypothetical protein